MGSSGQSAMDALAAKQAKIEADVQELEKRIYELETVYCGQAECTAFGTVTKGFEGFLTSKNAQLKNKGRTFKVDERLFSLSSGSSQATREFQNIKELEEAQNDGRRGRGFGKAASGRFA